MFDDSIGNAEVCWGDGRCTVLRHPSDDSFVQVRTYMMTRQPVVWFSLHDVLGDDAEDLGSIQHENESL